MVQASTLIDLSGAIVGSWSTSHQFQITIRLPCERTTVFISLMKSTNTSAVDPNPRSPAYRTNGSQMLW